MPENILGAVVDTPTPCSCSMCGNPRKKSWAPNIERLTMQERKANESFEAGIDEVIDSDTEIFYDLFYDNIDWYLRWTYIKPTS